MRKTKVLVIPPKFNVTDISIIPKDKYWQYRYLKGGVWYESSKPYLRPCDATYALAEALSWASCKIK